MAALSFPSDLRDALRRDQPHSFLDERLRVFSLPDRVADQIHVFLQRLQSHVLWPLKWMGLFPKASKRLFDLLLGCPDVSPDVLWRAEARDLQSGFNAPLTGDFPKGRVTQDMGVDVDLLIVGKLGVGSGGNFLQGAVDVGLGQPFAGFRRK
jgi:hypothetical protein